MSIADQIREKLGEAEDLLHLEVVNESGAHNVPPGSETHFKVILVAQRFAGQRLLERHRWVHGLLREELAGPVHALSVHAYSPDEWQARHGDVPLSPPCQGGKRRERH